MRKGLGRGYFDPSPAAATHVAALRDWEGRYGAELVGLTYDVMELKVKRRPADRDEAVRLAFEHYEICPDIANQGTAGIIGLASALMKSDWWYFWWHYEYDL